MRFRRASSEKVSLLSLSYASAREIVRDPCSHTYLTGISTGIFQRLEIYAEATLDQKMVDTVMKIMVEVLNIIGIATKEIKQSRMSMSFLYEKSSPHVASANPWMAEEPRGDAITTGTTWIQRVQPGRHRTWERSPWLCWS